jgi:hypothetical protein
MLTDLLRTLATNFESNSALAAKAIRQVYLASPMGFPLAVAELLSSEPDLPGTSYLMAILVAEPDWLRTVCCPEKYTLEQSLRLIRRARKLDAMTEVKLAKMLADLKFVNDDEKRFAARVIEVLERSPDQSTTLPALRQLAQSQNARLRSKAALLIGRINQNPQWATQGGSELDPRVSANSVESLWGLTKPGAREVFLKAARDQHHRISANGIVGLYLRGDESAISLLFHLSASEAPRSRAAATWAMGHLEDPRFAQRLTRMMSDIDEVTRKGAFRAIARIRQREVQLRAVGTVLVQLRDVECRNGNHRIRLLVTSEGQPVKGLDARQFVIWSSSDVIENFSSSLHEGADPYYEIIHSGPPSPTSLVKVQVYAPAGVGEATGFEMAFE